MNIKSVPSRIVQSIIDFMLSSSYLNTAWENFDEEVQEEIRADWEGRVDAILNPQAQIAASVPFSSFDGVSEGIVRYYRPKMVITDKEGNELDANYNLGGIVMMFNIHHDTSILRVGYSICKAHENFDKARGRHIAHRMLAEKHKDVLEIHYDPSISLFTNVQKALWGAISGENDTLLNNLDDLETRTRLGFLQTAMHNISFDQT